MTKPVGRRIEREFGVPIPGHLRDPEEWTKTALRALPEGHCDWSQVFDRPGPVMLDIGCGNGRSTLASAVLRPEFNHLATDSLPVVIRYATRRGNQRGLSNVRFAVCDGLRLLARHIAPRSVREIHVYHPQPWYDPADYHKRLVTPEFLALVHRALEPEGQLVLQTDHPAYWRYMSEIAPAFFHVTRQERPWPDAPRGRTRREIIALRSGLPVFRAIARPIHPLTESELATRVAALPAPTFEADRSLAALDAREAERD
jgi:tRNA (guanine-N7-)-methyltransferase